MSLDERMRRIAEERERLIAEETSMRAEVMAELDRLNEEIEALESRKDQLEAFLGLNDLLKGLGTARYFNCVSTPYPNAVGA